LWSDGNPFICIEPCWGLPDHHEQRPFEQKLGIQVIPAGGKREVHCAFEIEVI
jgi:galactose mutarotase-like enzyme